MFNETTEGIGSQLAATSADILGVVAGVALLLALSLSKGRDELLAIMFALYPAALITEYLPFYQMVSFGGGSADSVEKLVVFVVTFIISLVIIRSYVDTAFEQRALWRFIEGFVLSVTTIGLTLAVLYHIVHIEMLYNFSGVFDIIVMSPTALFLWLVAPLVSISLFVRP